VRGRNARCGTNLVAAKAWLSECARCLKGKVACEFDRDTKGRRMTCDACKGARVACLHPTEPDRIRIGTGKKRGVARPESTAKPQKRRRVESDSVEPAVNLKTMTVRSPGSFFPERPKKRLVMEVVLTPLRKVPVTPTTASRFSTADPLSREADKALRVTGRGRSEPMEVFRGDSEKRYMMHNYSRVPTSDIEPGGVIAGARIPVLRVSGLTLA
jgi:hypothetical protein